MILLEDLPSEILLHILTRVPGIDLVRSCVLVNRKWKDTIDSSSFWRTKCEKTGRFQPHLMPRPTHDNFKKLFFCNPYGRNLLKNPSALYGCSKWRIKEDGGNGFNVEDPAEDVKPLGDFVNIQDDAVMVWSTSYYWCVKSQEVDLVAEGVDAAILDQVKPHILVSEWYAARRDSGCAYEMTVRLLDRMGCSLDGNTFLKQFRQGEGGDWHKISHTFKDYPSGVRYVDFRHGGKDLEFKPGHYGTKFTLSSVTLKFERENNSVS